MASRRGKTQSHAWQRLVAQLVWRPLRAACGSGRDAKLVAVNKRPGETVWEAAQPKLDLGEQPMGAASGVPAGLVGAADGEGSDLVAPVAHGAPRC